MLGTFEYVRARTVDEATNALAEAEGAVALAGGTDLLVEVRAGARTPRRLVDIKRIETLQDLTVEESRVRIGAAVSLNRVIETRPLRERIPGVAAAAESIATYQLRNRATLVGNLCNASPAADMAPILLALGTVALTSGPSGVREIPLSAFFAGVKRNALQRAEILTEISIPTRSGVRTASLKQQRIRGHDLAVVNAGGAYDPEADRLTLAVGSCAPVPTLIEPMTVSGQTASDLTARALEQAGEAICPIDDVRASAAYRSAVLPVLLRRLIGELLQEGGV